MVVTACPPVSADLQISRIPGEQGAIIRCSGVLTLTTEEALRRELALQVSLGQPTLILNLANCGTLDVDGILLILNTYKHIREQGHRFAVVSGTDAAARILQVLGIENLLPVFPTEAVAELALRGGGPSDPAPTTWREAQVETLARWRAVRTLLEAAPTDEVVRRITSTHGLCRRADEVLQARSTCGVNRCELCPLFHALGGHAQDVGCHSLTQPMLEALLAGDRRSATAQVDRLIHTLEEMPLPQD